MYHRLPRSASWFRCSLFIGHGLYYRPCFPLLIHLDTDAISSAQSLQQRGVRHLEGFFFPLVSLDGDSQTSMINLLDCASDKLGEDRIGQAEWTTSLAGYDHQPHNQQQAKHSNDSRFHCQASFLLFACLRCQLTHTTAPLTDSPVCTPAPSLYATHATYLPSQ